MKGIQLLEILLDNIENLDELLWEDDFFKTALELAFEKIGYEPQPDPETSNMFETMIKILLKKGACVNKSRNKHSVIDNLLFMAVNAGRCDLIEVLIQHGAHGLCEAFEMALLAGKVECAEFLLNKGAEGNLNQLALQVVATEKVASIRFLHDKCHVDVSNPFLVLRAVVGGHVNMVRVLIELGAVVNAKNECFLHHVKGVAMAALLVDHGADVNAALYFSYGLYHELPLTIAIKQKRADLVKFYLSHGASVSVTVGDSGLPVLQCLCDNPSSEILDLLLDAGVNLDYRNKNGESTIVWAVKQKKLSLLQLLIEKGANVNLADKVGLSPLMHAVKKENDDATIKCLINAGADINRQDSCGNSALIHCAKSSFEGSAKGLKLLVEAGANVNIQNQDKEAAILVLHSYSFEIIKTLLEAGADVNITDEDGDTPLMNLVDRISMVDKERIQIFLDYGADVNFVRREEDYKPTTALSISFYKWVLQRGCIYGYTQLNDGSSVTHLLEAGADPSLTPDTKRLLHWAILFNQRSLIPILVTSGLSPLECDCKSLRRDCRIPIRGYHGHVYTASPFILALSLGRLSIAKFLADISFFTVEDIGQGYSWTSNLRNYLRSKGYVQTLAYMDEFISVPKSLVDLSSVVVSAHLSDRKRAVMSLELPLSLQHRLCYLHTHIRLGPNTDETLNDEQYRLTDCYCDEYSDEDDF